ncbi:MAG TPA: polysaccharide deacetylase family protein, partial [Blastocatellia bacterium]|nr:polysaccharide deacetylase family protein [Blastocatellia bacterium]
SALRSGQSVNVFFRDDDVAEDEPTLRRLLDLFAEFEIPINLEIIPGKLTEAAIALLGAYRAAHPDLFEFNQHGWMHVNHETEGRKCEFGASRSFDEQLADIRQGREVLQDAFGEAFSPVFTPPWNRCTEATYQALDQLQFRALSKLRGKTEVTGHGFRELSVTLDLFRWKGGATMKAPREFIEELHTQLRELDTVGIMLHHQVMDEAAFEFLALLLEMLRGLPQIRFQTFRSLLD